MKGIETGKDKVKKICEVLRKETLEPAKKEANEIIDEARSEAEKVLREAHRKAEHIVSEAKTEMEKQKNVFHSSINQASKQAIESLKQQIEEKLFNRELGQLIIKHTQDPKILAELISGIIKALERDGVNGDLSAYIPASVQAKAVNALLAEQVISKLKEKSVLLGTMAGGVEVKIRKENISIDITDVALKDLLINFIRKDFREMIFGAN